MSSPISEILQVCLPNEENLGDQLCHFCLDRVFARANRDVKITKMDLTPYITNADQFYDYAIDEINEKYDALIIGPGGLLAIHLLCCFFKDASTWKKLKIPLIFFGIGNILNLPNPKQTKVYDFSTLMYADDITKYAPNLKSTSFIQNYSAALNAATLIGVRDLMSWFMIKKVVHHTEHTFLTGCPTLFEPDIVGSLEKKYKLGINIPFRHEPTISDFQDDLIKIVSNIARNNQDIVIICHSNVEAQDAKGLLESLKLDIAVEYPQDFQSVGDVYQQCEIALVTKLHSAYFCLANNVPFAFLSYDTKCNSLAEMTYNFPNLHVLNINEIPFYDLDKKLNSIFYQTWSQKKDIKISQRILLDTFKKDYDLFLQKMFKLI